MKDVGHLALDYREACAAMRELWVSIMSTEAGSEERRCAARAHREGRERVEACRRALLDAARGAETETGTEIG